MAERSNSSGDSKTGNTNKTIGDQAEAIARKHLEQQRYQFVEANYRCRFGEIDLIMKNKHSLVFIEVKFRRSDRYGHAQEMVTPSKQRKLITAAEYFLVNHSEYQNCACRFDVVAIEYDNSRNLVINWIENAFTAL